MDAEVEECERQGLLSWFDREARDLPWRVSRGKFADPYRVLVSEIMLQQTQVAVVIPRYREFLSQFGTVQELARADVEQVRAAWSGLGYYRRAERLHQSARAIDQRGAFPKTAKELRLLPGVGEYTAAAVASIAFGEAIPVLDGNVARVLSRFLANKGDTKRSAVRKQLLAQASRFVEPDRAGDSNQAMMELGATVCTKVDPTCHRCPLEKKCRARGTNRQTAYPAPIPARPRKKQTWFQQIVLRGEDEQSLELLLEKRGLEQSRLPGMWLLPETDSPTGEQATRSKEGAPPLAEEVARFNHAIVDTDYQIILLRREETHLETKIEVKTNVVTKTGGGKRTRAVGCPQRRPSSAPSEQWCWVPLADFDENGRWHGSRYLPTSSMLAKAVRVILRDPSLGL